MRIGILAFIHESNTFLATPTTIDLFKRDFLLSGEAIRTRRENGVHETSGFFQTLKKHNAQAVPLFYASTSPSGTITKATCETLMDMMFKEVDSAGPLDGYLVAAHGANAGEGPDYRDIDGYLLARLRKTVGPNIPIVTVIDPHCNLSQQMVDSANAIISYRSNPHLDQLARGVEAAELIIKIIQGKVKPTQAACYPPFAVNIERQNTNEPHWKGFYALADKQLTQKGVLSNSINFGFPYSDVEKMGSSFIVVTDNDPALARKLVNELGQYLLDHKENFVAQYNTIADAVTDAINTPGTVGLLDMGDNVGAGSAADGTLLLQELHNRKVNAFVTIYDPESCLKAIAAGPGATLTLPVGGKTDKLHGPTLTLTFTVRGIHEGIFKETGVTHGGQTDFNIGQLATVVTDSGVTISLTQRRVLPLSIGHITCTGLDPKSFKVIVGKGVQSPVPPLKPICSKLIRVNTPGATTADMTLLPYQFRRKPLFPFEPIPATV
jgi:microcystin degradation protein MlrC